MRWQYILYVVGILVLFLGFSMAFPLACGVYYGDGSASSFVGAMLLSLSVGIALFGFFRAPSTEYISPREGMAIVTLGWTAAGVVGALPFYMSGGFETFVDAFFESLSGFTTTGASVMTNIEAASKGMLFWRSQIQWLGGMGIIVLSLAILPFLGVGGMQLYKAEVPSPVPDKLKPRLRDTAMLLWKVYALFTVIEVILLMFGGMSLYDAVCHTFTTMPTGGFSTRNTSVAYYDSVYIDGVIIVFMMLAGINFSLHYQMLRGKPLAFWRDAECRFFVGIVILFTLILSWNLYGDSYASIGQSLRYGAFQVVSIVTTTGFATADYEQWPGLAQVIILFCMFMGASAGSTGGGMKCIRVMMSFKYCYKELFALIHPRAVTQIKIAGVSVSDDIVQSIVGFLTLYVGLFTLSSVLLAATGVDFVTALTAVASALGNIGPGFGYVGPVENYAQIPYLGKWILIFCMLLGRLEIYTVIVLFVPEFWRK